MRYFALGGTADLVDVDAYLAGLLPLAPRPARPARPRRQRTPRRARPRAPGRPTAGRSGQGRPTTGPLAALLELLDAAGSAPPERHPRPGRRRRARLLGAEVVVHLIDHEQRCLVRLPAADRARRTPRRAWTARMAGRAFRTLQILSSDREGRPRLWVPIMDGADRLGVLEVGLRLGRGPVRPGAAPAVPVAGVPPRPPARLDGALRRRAGAARRSRPLAPSAELIWQQLPPLTAATDSFVLAGMLEPSYEVGGRRVRLRTVRAHRLAGHLRRHGPRDAGRPHGRGRARRLPQRPPGRPRRLRPGRGHRRRRLGTSPAATS